MGAFKLERDNPQIIMSGRLEHLFGGFTNMMPGENGVGEILEGFGEYRVKRRPDVPDFIRLAGGRGCNRGFIRGIRIIIKGIFRLIIKGVMKGAISRRGAGSCTKEAVVGSAKLKICKASKRVCWNSCFWSWGWSWGRGWSWSWGCSRRPTTFPFDMGGSVMHVGTLLVESATLVAVLSYYGIVELDAVVVSHFDQGEGRHLALVGGDEACDLCGSGSI
jgi:hypothetical protein